jgi:hypothetical protein
MTNKSIVICGDSFNIGIGCRDLENEPYGSSLSKKLDCPLLNLSKGSSTNLSIYLQVKYAIENFKDDIEYVIFSHTSYNRVDWFPVGFRPTRKEISLTDVNYHQYPPYGDYTYITKISHPMENDPRYVGKMFTENIIGVIDYWETFASKNKPSGYYARFADEPKSRTKILYDWGLEIMHDSINRLNSIGMMNLAHTILNKHQIKHLLLTHEVDAYSQFIPKQNLLHINWIDLSNKYPDDLPTKHTSAQGHKIVFEQVLNKFYENNWLARI